MSRLTASVSADVCYYDAQGEVVTLHGTGDGVSSVISDAVSSAGLTVDLGPVNIRSFGGVFRMMSRKKLVGRVR